MDELSELKRFRATVRRDPEARARAGAALAAAIAGQEGRRLPAGPLLAAVLLASAVAVAGTAYALERYVFVGDPAPAEIKEFAERRNEVKGLMLPPRRPEPPGPQVIVDQLHAGAVLQSSAGPVYLWVAPSTTGGYCALLDIGRDMPDGRPNVGGGCEGRRRILDLTLSGTRARNGRWLVLLYGRVRKPPVHRLEARLDDGKVVKMPLSGRFFLSEIPGLADSEPPLTVVAYDKAGREVARDRHAPQSGPLPQPVERFDPTGRRPLLQIHTRRTKKPIRLYVYKEDYDRCRVLVTPGGTSSGCGLTSPRPRTIWVSPNQIGTDPTGMVLLWGQVGSAIASLELHFEDGRREELRLKRGWALYQVAPKDLQPGRYPSELIGRDERGAAVARKYVRR